MDNNGKAVLQTLLYSDIFDYPLTQKEIWQFFIGKSFSKALLPGILKELAKTTAHIGEYYCLKGRENIIKKRKQREEISKQKLAFANRIISFLSFIPTIYFIGISGGLARANADSSDDIDLFIITKKNTMFITRLLVLFVLELFGVRRKRTGKQTANIFCCNMFLEENTLVFDQSKQDIYTAYEIIQMKPMFHRNNTYEKFLKANEWVKKILPHSDDLLLEKMDIIQNSRKENIFISSTLRILNLPARILQLWLIKKHQTSEIITNNFLAFHPRDYHNETLEAFEKRVRKYIG